MRGDNASSTAFDALTFAAVLAFLGIVMLSGAIFAHAAAIKEVALELRPVAVAAERMSRLAESAARQIKFAANADSAATCDCGKEVRDGE